MITRLDAKLLRELAQLAGGEGHYFHLDAKHFDTGEVVDQLRRLKRGDLDERVVHQPKEVYQWLLFPALLLLILEACVSERRRVPRRERGEA